MTLGLGTVAAGLLARSSGNTVEVQALWYGLTADGSAVGGVTPVRITAIADDPGTPFSLDLNGLRTVGAGEMWTAATADAAVQAVLQSGVDPRDVELRFSLEEAIDGPSAGALMTVGSLAAMSGAPVASATTMTGTVLPDGSVGPVSGLAEKVRAAGEAGFTRVLIPPGPSSVLDPATGSVIDVVEVGEAAGVEVMAVSSISDAYGLITDQSAQASQAVPPPIEPRILQLLTRRSRALNASTNVAFRELSHSGAAGPGRVARAESANVSDLVDAAEVALARGDPVLAFSTAAEAAQAVREWEASADLHAVPAGTPLSERTAGVRSEAVRVKSRILADIRSTAELPVTKVEQLPALSDALAWGVFGLTSVDVVLERLKSVTTEAQLDEIVRFLEVGRFEAETYMPVCAESVAFVGDRPIPDVADTVSLLDSYVDFLDYASDANRAYASSLGSVGDATDYLDQLMSGSDALTDSVSDQFPALKGPTAQVALRMSAALLDYVETTQLVNDLTSRDFEGADGPPNLAPIEDPVTVRTQARVADDIAAAQVKAIASVGMDPSYVRWNSQWGADLAFGQLPNTTDEQTLHGLEFQWFAVLQSRLVMALNGSDGRDWAPQGR